MAVPGGEIGKLIRRARVRAGLSPSELSERSGVGLDWLELFERGEIGELSAQTLSWITAALQLGRRDRQRLFLAAGLDEPLSPPRARLESVPAAVDALLASIRDIPAYVTGARFDVLAWNDGAGAVYRCEEIPAEERNSLLFMFTRPETRKLIMNWEQQARTLIASYRASARASDPWSDWIRATLEAKSADFRRMWRAPAEVPGADVKRFRKRGYAELVFDEGVALVESQDTPLRLHWYAPHTASVRRELARLVAAHRRRQGVHAHERAMRSIRHARAVLDERFADTLPLEALARLVGIDKFQLVRVFAREVGMTPHAYQLLVRIDRARVLLSEGVAPAVVATQVGFSDQSHFGLHFKRLEGTTPSRYARTFA